MYRDYIACLNKQDWTKLGQFVHDDVHYNGQRIGLSGYREMLACTPKGKFLGLNVNGKTVSFTENVFYQFQGGKIEHVWSVIDKAAIEAQL